MFNKVVNEMTWNEIDLKSGNMKSLMGQKVQLCGACLCYTMVYKLTKVYTIDTCH